MQNKQNKIKGHKQFRTVNIRFIDRVIVGHYTVCLLYFWETQFTWLYYIIYTVRSDNFSINHSQTHSRLKI